MSRKGGGANRTAGRSAFGGGAAGAAPAPAAASGGGGGAVAKAAGRGTAERGAKATQLAGLRKQLNNVNKDLRHFNEAWQKRAHPGDESRRDRLNEKAFLQKTIARVRGKS